MHHCKSQTGLVIIGGFYEQFVADSMVRESSTCCPRTCVIAPRVKVGNPKGVLEKKLEKKLDVEVIDKSSRIF